MICKMGFESDLLVQNGLMHLYGKCGEMSCALKVFDGMCERDVVSWTTVIDGYSTVGGPDEALRMFYLMWGAGVRPNEVTMVSLVSACSQLGILSLGKSVHKYVEKSGVSVSVNLTNSLVDMYGKCGCLVAARKVFDGMEGRDAFSWTSMMNAYAKCGHLELAKEVFDEMPVRNAISWSCMISGYSQANQPKEALRMFREMIAAGVEPIDATLVSVLSACAQNGCLELGRWIYTHYIHKKRMKLTVKMANAFIDMYGKCGAIEEAVKLFHDMSERDLVSWNTMIMAFAIHGYGKRALSIFEQFKNTGMVPNDITFVGVLSACSHIGLVAEGRKHFEDMKTLYGIEPKAKHYACLIDLLGRVGLLEDAYELARSMPMKPDEAAWGALLNACKMHGNIELGTYAGEKLLVLDPGDSGTYALLSNIYATRNRWNDVKRVKSLMRERGVRKTPGCSSIEVEGKFHEFFAAGQSHFLSKDIYVTLSVLCMHLRWEGHVLDYEHCYSCSRNT